MDEQGGDKDDNQYNNDHLPLRRNRAVQTAQRIWIVGICLRCMQWCGTGQVTLLNMVRVYWPPTANRQ